MTNVADVARLRAAWHDHPAIVKLCDALVAAWAENTQFRELLHEWADDDPFCRYDQHGYCQVHGLSPRPCIMDRTWAALSAGRPAAAVDEPS